MATLREIQNRFMEEINVVDDLAQIVLKGHLVIEELLTEALQRFVHHSDYIASARLQFHQKLNLCRAISVSEQDNEMWELIAKINNIRNHLSHSLGDEERVRRVRRLKSHYEQLFGRESLEAVSEMDEESAVCMLAISGCLGFLHTFLGEVQSFEAMIDRLQKVFKPEKDA